MAFEHDYEAFPELTNTQLEELQFSSPHVQITDDFRAMVVKVHDGDTVTLRVSFRDFDFPLRLAEIDAPELNSGGNVARDWLQDKVLGREVTVLIDPSNRVGRYGRLIGSLMYLGMDLGVEMYHLGLVSKFGSKNEGFVPELGKIMREVAF